MKNLVIPLLLSFITLHAFGQCAITAGNDTILPYIMPITLNAGFDTSATCTGSSYIGNEIPYDPYPFMGDSIVHLALDDYFGPIDSLPFKFIFFGTDYDAVTIGANATICFAVDRANTNSPWMISDSLPVNNDSSTMNNIMVAYADIYPVLGGTISYKTYGTSPCRKFVVSFDSIPMFSCNTLFYSSQAVLHEGSNIIEVFVNSKPSCSAWNNDYSILGIENATGTVYYTAPGMNPYVGAITHYGYRFSPSPSTTASAYTWNWYDDSGNFLGTGQNITVTPSTTTTYTVHATAPYGNLCDSITLVSHVTVILWPTGISNIQESSMSIYPNPANNILYIDKVKNKNTTYRITNTIGTVVQQGLLQQGNNSISLALLPAGIYILECMDNEGLRKTTKIIKE